MVNNLKTCIVAYDTRYESTIVVHLGSKDFSFYLHVVRRNASVASGHIRRLPYPSKGGNQSTVTRPVTVVLYNSDFYTDFVIRTFDFCKMQWLWRTVDTHARTYTRYLKCRSRLWCRWCWIVNDTKTVNRPSSKCSRLTVHIRHGVFGGGFRGTREYPLIKKYI